MGPMKTMDVVVVAPCTGNTMSKSANGITDGAVTMACKAHPKKSKANSHSYIYQRRFRC